MREREEALREEYDKVLSEKLAEQYDAFVKFTYDQIQRRLNDRPMSYVSWFAMEKKVAIHGFLSRVRVVRAVIENVTGAFQQPG